MWRQIRMIRLHVVLFVLGVNALSLVPVPREGVRPVPVGHRLWIAQIQADTTLLRRIVCAGISSELGEDVVHLELVEGLAAGPVTLRDAWRVFGRNRSLRVVRVPVAKLDTLFSLWKLGPAAIGHRYARVATSHPTVTHILALTGITHEAIEPQAVDDPGFREVDLVTAWLQRQQVGGE